MAQREKEAASKKSMLEYLDYSQGPPIPNAAGTCIASQIDLMWIGSRIAAVEQCLPAVPFRTSKAGMH